MLWIWLLCKSLFGVILQKHVQPLSSGIIKFVIFQIMRTYDEYVVSMYLLWYTLLINFLLLHSCEWRSRKLIGYVTCKLYGMILLIESNLEKLWPKHLKFWEIAIQYQLFFLNNLSGILIKIVCYHWKDSHCKDKMIWWRSYLHNENSYIIILKQVPVSDCHGNQRGGTYYQANLSSSVPQHYAYWLDQKSQQPLLPHTLLLG